jgi:hypothetical protein
LCRVRLNKETLLESPPSGSDFTHFDHTEWLEASGDFISTAGTLCAAIAEETVRIGAESAAFDIDHCKPLEFDTNSFMKTGNAVLVRDEIWDQLFLPNIVLVSGKLRVRIQIIL